jgi:peptide/nickel transport system permease protein
MLAYLLRRIVYALPIMLGVAFVCFVLVHISPGDPLVSILPPDASAELQQQLRELYGFDRSYPEQFASWIWRALQGDLGTSIATNRPVAAEVLTAVGNTLRLAVVATVIGFVMGCLFGFVAGYFRNSWIDRLASMLSVLGVSVPHYWLGMVMVIVFSSQLAWLPATGAGPGGSGDWKWDWEHLSFMVLPALTMSVIPMGIIARTVRALWPTSSSRSSSSACAPRGSRTWAFSSTWSRTRRRRRWR